MKIYIAARYQRRAEMERFGHELRIIGHEVLSSWIWHHNDLLDSAWRKGDEMALAQASVISRVAINEIADSDTLVAFTESGPIIDGMNTGGRHVELGIALAHQSVRRIIIVGKRENIFHALGTIEQVENKTDALVLIGAAPLVARQ